MVVAGIPHHITQRGNRRQQVFFRESDYQSYLQLLSEWCNAWPVEIWAYCLMPNHIHLIANPVKEDGLARAIGEAHRRYTRMINFRENWRGYLWQGRFSSYPLDEKYLLAATRYIELNPVRARLVDVPWEYQWSSALAHIQGRNDILVTVEPMLTIVGEWKDFLRMSISEAEQNDLRKHMRTGRPLGSEQFIKDLEMKLGCKLRPKKPGPKRSKNAE